MRDAIEFKLSKEFNYAGIVGTSSIKSGVASIMIAGGVEGMSRAPFVLLKEDNVFYRTNAIRFDGFVTAAKNGFRRDVRLVPITTVTFPLDIWMNHVYDPDIAGKMLK